MRVLIVNTTYGPGGVPVVVGNLHRGFLQQGIHSEILVGFKIASDFAPIHVVPPRGRFVERLTNACAYRAGLSNNGLLGTFRLPRERCFREADVLSLHNLHGGYFNFLALPKLTRLKPAVLTLHDMWTFTGHCVYSFECDRWRIGCGRCPNLSLYQGMKRDASATEHRLKRWSIGRSNLHFVAISRWIEQLARDSLIASRPIHYIPNGIDLEGYQPRQQAECRQVLGLPPNRKIILYVAHNLSDPRKGFDLLVKAVERLPDTLRRECFLLILGEAKEAQLRQVRMEHIGLGYLAEVKRKALVYGAADVFAFPTRADNLPLVLQESMACGTPMVSFAVGGVPDLVRDGETGFSAPAEDVDAFVQRLRQLLEDAVLLERMQRRCREIAVAEYSIELQAKRYVNLFNQLK